MRDFGSLIRLSIRKGLPKLNEADEMQLCGQAICLEEMLLCRIPGGSLFYGENRRREPVEFTEELRGKVYDMAKEMHVLWDKGYTPRVKPQKGCNACSLKEIIEYIVYYNGECFSIAGRGDSLC